jgi:hypothetical protein
LIIGSELEERRSFLPQSFQVDNFIIRGAGLPALPDDAHPLESERADRGVVFFVPGALGVVVSAGPERVLNGLGGELMKSLAKELRTKVAPANAKLLTTAFNDRSDPEKQSSSSGDCQRLRSEPRAAVRRAA